MSILSQEVRKIAVSAVTANALLRAAENLPVYDHKDYYTFDVQASIHQQVSAACPAEFDELIRQIRAELSRRPYYALVRGLKFDDEHKLFVAINRAFGDLVASPYKKPRGQLVHHIHPVTDLSATRGKKYETEKMHTDTADWEDPVKLISMVCVRSDAHGGGSSQLIDMDTIRTELQRRGGAEIVRLLEEEPLPWQIAPYRGGGIQWRPVLNPQMILWRRYTVEAALRDLGETLSPEMSAAMDLVEEVLDSTTAKVEFLMEEDELLFLDNLRSLHARTPISHSDVSDRFMIRSWIQTSPEN